MARPYADDLRCRILQAYEQGEGSQPQLAQRFRVSVSYVEKIHRQWRRSGKMERIPHHPGRKPRFTEAIRQQLRGWLQQRPDLTLAELQEKLLRQAQLEVSQPALWTVLRKMGWRLKKNHSTRKNATQRRTGSGVRSSPKSLPR
jgi:transposase